MDGEAGAGQELVSRYVPTIYRFFRNKVPREMEDLSQRTFLALLKSRERARSIRSFRAYLLTIARNELLMHIRRHERASGRLHATDISVHDIGDEFSSCDALAHSAEQVLLLRALRRAPLDLQTTIELVYWEQLSLQEAGEVLGVPVGTVKSRIARAKGLLREIIEGLEADQEVRNSTLVGLETWVSELRRHLGRGSTTRRGG